MKKSYLVERLEGLFDIADLTEREKTVLISIFIENLTLEKTSLRILKEKDCRRWDLGSPKIYPKGTPVHKQRVRDIKLNGIRKLRKEKHKWMSSEFPIKLLAYVWGMPNERVSLSSQSKDYGRTLGENDSSIQPPAMW